MELTFQRHITAVREGDMATEGKTPDTGDDTGNGSAKEYLAGSQQDGQGASSAGGEGAGAPLSESIQKSARTLSREIKREGRRLVNDATDSAASVAAEKKDVAAGYLRTVGDAIFSGCEVLDEQGYRGSSKLVRYVAEEIDLLADTLEDREPRALLTGARNYARANPAVFLGAALLVGFGLVRLLKSDEDGADDQHAGADDDDAAYPYADEGVESGTYQNQQM